MPQLDTFTFFASIFWLLLGLIIIYLILILTGIPRIYKILQYRKKLVTTENNKINITNKELFILINILYKVNKNLILEQIKKSTEKTIDISVNSDLQQTNLILNKFVKMEKTFKINI